MTPGREREAFGYLIEPEKVRRISIHIKSRKRLQRIRRHFLGRKKVVGRIRRHFFDGKR